MRSTILIALAILAHGALLAVMLGHPQIQLGGTWGVGPQPEIQVTSTPSEASEMAPVEKTMPTPAWPKAAPAPSQEAKQQAALAALTPTPSAFAHKPAFASKRTVKKAIARPSVPTVHTVDLHEDSQTEASSAEVQAATEVPTEIKESEQMAVDTKETEEDAEAAPIVSYLELKQAPGNIPAAYPKTAERAGHEGQVDLVYRVTSEGDVADVRVEKSSGFEELDQAAVKAISKYRFIPGPERWARHPVSFNLAASQSEVSDTNE